MKRRSLAKNAGVALIWATPLVTTITLPAHAVTSELPRPPSFEVIGRFNLHIDSRPNLIVRLSDDQPGIAWTTEFDSQLSLFPGPGNLVYRPLDSGNSGSSSSVDLDFFGVPQSLTFIRITATDLRGNTEVFETSFGVA